MRLLTLGQIEDYLIYHCKLLRSTPMDTDYRLTTEQLRRAPFLVKFKVPGTYIVELTAVHNTPWKAYSALAKMVWEDINAHHYITDLYYKS